MDLRPGESPATYQTSSATTAPPPLSPTTIAIAIMTAHRHPLNAWFPKGFNFQHRHGIKIPPQHVFGQPSRLRPSPPKSQLGLPRMADRAFSHHTCERETIFPNPYKEDLYRLNGYHKNVATYTDHASWDFSLAMPKPVPFKTAWTGAAADEKHDMGFGGADEKKWEDIDNETDDEAEDSPDGDHDEDDNEDWSDVDTDDDEDERPRGRSPTPRRCTNGLGSW